MVSFTYVIRDELGIHARPGGLLVQEAGRLTSNITIIKGAKEWGCEEDLQCHESCC